jgi:hypothetical protein
VVLGIIHERAMAVDDYQDPLNAAARPFDYQSDTPQHADFEDRSKNG